MAYVILIIIFSFLIHLCCYVIVSKQDDSYLNVFFPYFLSNIPINFIFEPLFIYYYGLAASVYAYFVIYACYTGVIISMTISYTIIKKSVILKLPFSSLGTFNSKTGFALIILAVLVYMPVLIEFKEFIFNPREIYTRTRTGYGLYFFTSTFLVLIGYIIVLFSKNITFAKIFFLSILVTLFLYLHGSKGQVTLLFSIIALYYVYLKNWKVNLKTIGALTVCLAAIVVTLFYLTTSFEYENIFKLMLSYSDYNRNGMTIIDHQKSFFNGQITFESNFYSRIPRFIMPDKPKDYGVFKLAKIYFPSWFYSDTGSPAFGLGVQYADFGLWSILYLSIWGGITGFLMKLFVNRLKFYKSPGDFIAILFLTGLVLIPIGDGYLLPEHLLTGLFLNMLLSVRFTKSG